MSVEIPNPATQACQRFFDDLTSLVSFTVYLAQVVDRREAREGEAREGESLAATTVERDVFTRRLGAFSPVLLQMVFSRGVDVFLIYLSDLLGLVFRTRPETLRSSEQVKVEEILEHDSIEELIDFLATRRVEKLAYAGLRSLAADLESDLAFQLFTESAYLDNAVRIVELRNLIVHNRAVVNATYLRRVPNGGEPGQELSVTGTYVFDALRFLGEGAAGIDVRAIEKFGVPAEPTTALPDDVTAALVDRDWIVRVPDFTDPERAPEPDDA